MTENRKVVDVYFSLGSNLGNRMLHLTTGLASLGKLGEQVAISSVVETPAWGYDDPNSYLNIAAHFRMDLTPEELYLNIKKIETNAGRNSRNAISKGYEARTLDIDILFYADLTIDTPDLQIPHPRMQLRNFVLNPLSEIAFSKIHPILKMTVAEMLKNSPDKSTITRFADGV